MKITPEMEKKFGERKDGSGNIPLMDFLEIATGLKEWEITRALIEPNSKRPARYWKRLCNEKIA